VIQQLGKIKVKRNEQAEAERKLAEMLRKKQLFEENGIEVNKEEEEQLKKNIATIEEQISVIENGFSTYQSYLEQGEAATDIFKKSYEQQLLNIEAQITSVEKLQKEDGLTKEHIATLDILLAKKNQLIKTNILDAKWEDLTLNMKLNGLAKLASASSAFLGVNKKNALIAGRLDQSAALINTFTAVTDVLKEGTGPMRYVEAAAALAYGLAQVGKIESQLSQMGGGGSGGGSTPQFAEGGYVGGRPHSQGGTIIEAERGEFVMSRNATESIGLETLNQMNQQGGGGSINVSVTGNVLTQDFVEGELAESIKEAVRRGSDFGLS